MFHQISAEIQTQMRRLETIDAKDRKDGTPHMHWHIVGPGIP